MQCKDSYRGIKFIRGGSQLRIDLRVRHNHMNSIVCIEIAKRHVCIFKLYPTLHIVSYRHVPSSTPIYHILFLAISARPISPSLFLSEWSSLAYFGSLHYLLPRYAIATTRRKARAKRIFALLCTIYMEKAQCHAFLTTSPVEIFIQQLKKLSCYYKLCLSLGRCVSKN